jgi:hypothetical protein
LAKAVVQAKTRLPLLLKKGRDGKIKIFQKPKPESPKNDSGFSTFGRSSFQIEKRTAFT